MTTNPFKKSVSKPSTLTITLQDEQRKIVEALGQHLGIKTNSGVALEALAVLYDKHRRQLEKGAAAGDQAVETTEAVAE